MQKKFQIAFGINMVIFIVASFMIKTDIGKLIFFISIGVLLITTFGAIVAPSMTSRKFNNTPIRYNKTKPHKAIWDTEPSAPETPLFPAAQVLVDKRKLLNALYRIISLISLILTFLLFMFSIFITLFDESQFTGFIGWLMMVNILGMIISGLSVASAPQKITAVLSALFIIADIFLVICCFFDY